MLVTPEIDFELFILTKMDAHFNINNSSAVAEMGDHGHNRHGPKRGGLLCPFQGRGLGPRLTQRGMRQGIPSYQVAS